MPTYDKCKSFGFPTGFLLPESSDSHLTECEAHAPTAAYTGQGIAGFAEIDVSNTFSKLLGLPQGVDRQVVADFIQSAIDKKPSKEEFESFWSNSKLKKIADSVSFFADSTAVIQALCSCSPYIAHVLGYLTKS